MLDKYEQWMSSHWPWVLGAVILCLIVLAGFLSFAQPRRERLKTLISKPRFSTEAGRLEAFSDGVMAVIITIMVLELRPPAAPI